jgi:tRNA 2-thiouridine synthesizing protein A
MTTYNLDITRERCPMTFVKAKLHLEQLEPGDTSEILLSAGEPLDNVPRTATEQGFEVLESIHVRDNIHKLIIRKP